MRQVVIFRRPSGTYGYREERHYENDLAGTEGWASLGGRASHYEDLETAKREVVENVPWVAKHMKTPRLITALSLGVICLAIGLAYAFLSRGDPCARLISLTEKVGRLQASRPRPYRFSDHVVGVLHHSNPLMYYERQAENEKKALLASGQLVEFRIPYTADGPSSDREIAKALLAVHQRTGADYWIDFDLTNHLMLIACRPGDVRKFPVLK